jgi:hypothetical protein
MLAAFCICADAQDVHKTVKITGVVGEAESSATIPGAKIEFLGETLSPILSRPDGTFECYIPPKNIYVLEITKDGYTTGKMQLQAESDRSQKIDLKVISSGTVTIEISGFVKNGSIHGRVIGLPASNRSKYKILVYVFTNQWYIHPYNERTEGRGFATIKEDGTWEIETKDWGHQAYIAAYLLVPKDFTPRSPIPVAEGLEPVNALRGAVHPVGIPLVEDPAREGM